MSTADQRVALHSGCRTKVSQDARTSNVLRLSSMVTLSFQARRDRLCLPLLGLLSRFPAAVLNKLPALFPSTLFFW